MIRRPPSTTRTDTLFPYTTLFRSGSEVLPVVVQSVSSAPAGSDLLVPVPAPPLDAGPHRSYAFQWFAFAAIVAIVYPLILRRVGHRVGEQVDEPQIGRASCRERVCQYV